LHVPDWLGALYVLDKVLLLAALRKLVNSLENATPLACLWATPKLCGNMVSLRLLALLWTRLSVSLAHLSLVAATALPLLLRLPPPPPPPPLLTPLALLPLQMLLTSALRKTPLR
jgi:hypothetical protein